MLKETISKPLTLVVERDSQLTPKFVGYWLLICCFMVGGMILLGGATRLTGSGLSIVDWKPLTGFFPPTSQVEWETLFASYKTSPEFMKINFWMTTDDFKSIYWLEYLHRLWGKLIGLVFLLPYLWIVIRRKIPFLLSLKLGGLFSLICLQGIIGWYMVKSGLVDEPFVSQYRLALHLGLAFLIFGLLFWFAINFLTPRRHKTRSVWLRSGSLIILYCTFITIISGAFVAGLDAGLTYNTFPLMDGQWVPAGILVMSPWWVNLFENTAAVQFTHRLIAIGTVTLTILFWILASREILDVGVSRAINSLTILVICQLGLGIATLLTEVEILLALLHQFGALSIFTASIWVKYQLGIQIE
ncbi:MAG: COX15/CtaA family protein [Pseudomonadota bacterium]|nr:COX15/CtaA family protein [Pseudomonadota bacterium]